MDLPAGLLGFDVFRGEGNPMAGNSRVDRDFCHGLISLSDSLVIKKSAVTPSIAERASLGRYQLAAC